MPVLSPRAGGDRLFSDLKRRLVTAISRICTTDPLLEWRLIRESSPARASCGGFVSADGNYEARGWRCAHSQPRRPLVNRAAPSC